MKRSELVMGTDYDAPLFIVLDKLHRTAVGQIFFCTRTKGKRHYCFFFKWKIKKTLYLIQYKAKGFVVSA